MTKSQRRRSRPRPTASTQAPERCGERPEHPCRGARCRVDLGRTDACGAGRGVRTLLHRPHPLGRHPRVRVEEEDVDPGALGRLEHAETQVDAAGEPEVDAGVDVASAVPEGDLPRTGEGGVVDDGDAERAPERRQAPLEERGRPVGDDEDVRIGDGTGRRVSAEDLRVEVEVALRDGTPCEEPGAVEPGGPEAGPPVGGGRLVDGAGEVVGVGRGDEEGGVTDDVGDGPGAGRDDGSPGRHRLDRDPAELLEPSRRGERRHGDDVEVPVGVRELVLARVAPDVDPVRDPEPCGLPLEGDALRAVADEDDVPGRPGGGRGEKGRDTLVRLEPSDVAHAETPRGRLPVPGGEPVDVDPEREEPRGAAQTLPGEDLTGLGVADVRPGRAAQGDSLEPAKGDRVALVDVLRGVEDVRGPQPAQGAEQEDLGDGEAARLLVEVEEVPVLAEEPPHRPGVVGEGVRVVPHGGRPGDDLVRGGDEVDVAPALVPPPRGEEVDVDARGAQPALPLPPGVDDPVVGDPQDPHRRTSSRSPPARSAAAARRRAAKARPERPAMSRRLVSPSV